MKVLNYVALASAGLLAACGGCSTIVEPENLNDERVYFAFDSSSISEEARNNLLGQSLYMKNHPDVNVVIGGYCDARGTVEYNLALGARRANAAKQIIVEDGIDASRIKTISYGKEHPLVLGTGEEVWAQNRAAVTRAKN